METCLSQVIPRPDWRPPCSPWKWRFLIMSCITSKIMLPFVLRFETRRLQHKPWNILKKKNKVFQTPTVRGQFWCTDIQIMRSTLFNCSPLFSSSALARHLNQQHLSCKTFYLFIYLFIVRIAGGAACHSGCINLGQRSPLMATCLGSLAFMSFSH